MSPRARRSRRLPILLVVAQTALGLAYVARVPAWEAPDEPWHLVYAESLARGIAPRLEDTYEAHHPAGYYALVALCLRGLGWGEVPRAPDNPRFPLAAAAYLHAPGDPGAARLALLRAFSLVTAAPALALAWAAARRLRTRAGPSGAGLAGALFVLIPSAAFLRATINNDTAAVALGAALWYAAVRWLEADAGRASRYAFASGLLASATFAVKLNVLGLLPAVALAPLLRRLAPREGRTGGPSWGRVSAELAMAAAGAVAGLAALAALQPAQTAALVGAALARGGAPTQGGPILGPLVPLVDSMWGRFGWLNVDLPAGLRQAMAAISAAAMVAGCLRLGQREPSAGRDVPGQGATWLALAMVAGVVAATLVNGRSDPGAIQGRLLLPAAAPACWLMARGLGRWGLAAVAALAMAQLAVLGWLLPMAYDGGPGSLEATLARPPLEGLAPDLRLAAGAWAGDADSIEQPLSRGGLAGATAIEIPLIVAEGPGRLEVELRRGAGGPALASRSFPLAGLARADIDDAPRVGPLADTAWVRLDLDDVPEPPGGRADLHLAMRIAGQGRAWFWTTPWPAGPLPSLDAPGEGERRLAVLILGRRP